LGIDIDIGNYYKDISLNEYAEENYAIKDGAALYFEINRSGTVDGNYLLTLYNSRDKKPPQVGGNPYIYNNSKDNPDIEYWTTLYREDFPAKVSIEKNFGSFSGGIVVLSVKDNGGSIDINWQDIQTMTDTNGDKIKFKPITSKVILGKCGNNKYYLFGGTGRWFYKEDNLETEEYMPNNFIFGIPVTCQNGSCNLASVEDVTDNINGTSNSQYGWYIKLANSNSTAELLREKDISDPNLSETTKVVIFATVQPSYSYCSISQGQTRFWAINCSNGGAINAKQATGNIVTQLSTSQIVNISLQKTFIGNNGGNSNTQASTRYTRLYAGIAATAAPQLILPYQLTTGKLLLWLEY
jgi:type IV pilus assembly protein PilY1